jgi:hypothetical protein
MIVGSLLFVGGVATAFLIMYLAYFIWRKKTEKRTDAILKDISEPTLNIINEAKVALDRLKNSSDKAYEAMQSSNKESGLLRSNLKDLSADMNKIDRTCENLVIVELLEKRLGEEGVVQAQVAKINNSMTASEKGAIQ